MNSRLYVGSDASFGGNLAIQTSKGIYGGSTTAVPSDLNVYGLNIGAGSFVSNSDCSFNGNINIGGNINISKSGTHYITGTLNTTTSVVTTSTVNGNETVGGTETVTGLLTASGGLVVNGTSTINGNLALSTSKGISGGSVSAVAADFNVYGLNIGAGSFVAASDCTMNGNVAINTGKGISGGSRSAVVSDLNVYGLNVGAGDLVIFDGGVVAIGTTNTTYPLFVNNISTSNISISNAARLNTSSGATINNSTTTASVSIRASGTIWSENNIFASSDIRIKTDINAINGNSALDKFRQLKPVEYYHIDKFDAGTIKKYGFIAQEVKKIIPESISFEKDYIPNIYDAATVIDNSFIVLDTKTTNGFTLSGETINIQLYDYKNRSKTVTLDKIVNSTSFTIKEPLADSDLSDNKIFVFGQEVNDFHILSKEIVFTIATAALLEVDKELEKTKIVVNDISMNMPLHETRLSRAEQIIEEQSILIRQLQEQINQLKH